MAQTLADTVNYLNAVLHQLFTERGLKWNPRVGDGLWVEERNGRLVVCDYNTASPLAPGEATPEGVTRIAEEWIAAAAS